MSNTDHNDRDRLRALQRSLYGRLEACSFDEARVLDRLLVRLELGRARYGALDLARDVRDWDAEAAEEREDQLIYQAMRDVAEHAARVEAIDQLDVAGAREDLLEPRDDG